MQCLQEDIAVQRLASQNQPPDSQQCVSLQNSRIASRHHPHHHRQNQRQVPHTTLSIVCPPRCNTGRASSSALVKLHGLCPIVEAWINIYSPVDVTSRTCLRYFCCNSWCPLRAEFLRSQCGSHSLDGHRVDASPKYNSNRFQDPPQQNNALQSESAKATTTPFCRSVFPGRWPNLRAPT